MQILFSKMHGLGNDFVVIDAINQSHTLNAEQMRFIADRHFGIGCDQILLVEPARQADVDFTYRIFNADGGEVEQCGNGARCFARFVRDKGLSDKDILSVATNTGVITLHIQADGQVTVNMGNPIFQPDQIPFTAEQTELSYYIDVNGLQLNVGTVSMGNPHVVLRVDSTSTAPVETLGPQLEAHPRFPKRVNVGFMQIVDRRQIKLRVFERGVGETLACGTGACAAVVIGIQQGLLDNQVQVSLPGGELSIQWAGEGSPVHMTGPATHVFEGSIDL